MRALKGVKAALANVTLPPSGKREGRERTTFGGRKGHAKGKMGGGKLKKRG